MKDLPRNKLNSLRLPNHTILKLFLYDLTKNYVGDIQVIRNDEFYSMFCLWLEIDNIELKTELNPIGFGQLIKKNISKDFISIKRANPVNYKIINMQKLFDHLDQELN